MDRKAQCAGTFPAGESIFHLLFAHSSDTVRLLEKARGEVPGGGDTADYLKRLALRTFGSRTEWEANPRLAGIPGSLPEFLSVEE